MTRFPFPRPFPTTSLLILYTIIYCFSTMRLNQSYTIKINCCLIIYSPFVYLSLQLPTLFRILLCINCMFNNALTYDPKILILLYVVARGQVFHVNCPWKLNLSFSRTLYLSFWYRDGKNLYTADVGVESLYNLIKLNLNRSKVLICLT